MKLAVLLALMLLLSGCLDCETYEIRILREQGDPAIVIAEYGNIYSDSTSTRAVQQDFDSLVKLWRGEEMLRDALSDGLLVKSRELVIEEGKIVGRMTGIANNVAALEDMSVEGSQIILRVEADSEVVETNGKLQKTPDGETVLWPREQTDIRVSFRKRQTESNGSGQAAILKLLTDYQVAR